MGAEEMQYWIAHDMLKDESFKQKVMLEISKEMDNEQVANAIKNMFQQIMSN